MHHPVIEESSGYWTFLTFDLSSCFYFWHSIIYLYSFTSVQNMCAILYVCVLLFPQSSQRSESHGSCKMKATALLHVTLPTFSFLFHWPQTPDFSEPKNRLLQTLTPPPHFPSPTPTVQAFIGMFLRWPFLASIGHTKPHVSIQSLCVKETSESFFV